MKKAYIKTILKMGDTHKICEDSNYFRIYNNKIFISSFDGCSSGVDSVFASNLFKKIMNKVIIDLINNDRMNDKTNEYIMHNIFISFKEKLIEIVNKLSLNIDEILSTIVFALLDLEKNETIFVVSGDGLYSFNGQIVNIEQDNTPNYLSYFLNGNVDIFSTFHIKKYDEEIKDVSVSSDGINSFSKLVDGLKLEIDFTDEHNEIYEKYLKDTALYKSDAMLARYYNIMGKAYSHYDDFNIVRVLIVSTDESI